MRTEQSESAGERTKITYLVNFLFEALLEHLVSFVKDDGLEGRKVDVSALDVVEDTTASTDEEVDTTTQSPRLVVDVHTAVDGERIELVGVVLQLLQLVLHLR